MSGSRVVVVGAGLAGLVAAHRLRAAQVDCVLLEASSQIGGRLRAETLDGVCFEPALHALPRSAPVIGGLVAELGLTKSVRRTPLEQVRRLQRGATVATSMRSVDSLAPGPLRGLRVRRLRCLVGWLGAAVDPQAPACATRLDDRSVADFAQLTLGARSVARLFAPLLELHFGHDVRDTSRQLLFTLLNAWGDVELSLAFGLSALPPALAVGLELRTEARVAAVLPGGRGIRLASGEQIGADAVVLAVPATHVTSLVTELSPAEREIFESARYLDALHLVVSCAPGVSAPVTWIPETEGGPLSGSIELPTDSPGRQLLLLTARPAFALARGQRSDAELSQTLLESAERIHPGLRAGTKTSRLLRLPASVPSFGPGRYRAAQRLLRERGHSPPRRIFFCGDYLHGPHAEGAAASGARIAAEVRAQLLSE